MLVQMLTIDSTTLTKEAEMPSLNIFRLIQEAASHSTGGYGYEPYLNFHGSTDFLAPCAGEEKSRDKVKTVHN